MPVCPNLPKSEKRPNVGQPLALGQFRAQILLSNFDFAIPRGFWASRSYILGSAELYKEQKPNLPSPLLLVLEFSNAQLWLLA